MGSSDPVFCFGTSLAYGKRSKCDARHTCVYPKPLHPILVLLLGYSGEGHGVAFSCRVL